MTVFHIYEIFIDNTIKNELFRLSDEELKLIKLKNEKNGSMITNEI